MKTAFLCGVLVAAMAFGCGAFAASPQRDGEQVYRNNCTRCHMAIHTFAPRMMATVTHHMQVRAMLTRDEQIAVLRYLLESSPSSEARKKTGGRN